MPRRAKSKPALDDGPTLIIPDNPRPERGYINIEPDLAKQIRELAARKGMSAMKLTSILLRYALGRVQ